MQELIDKVPLSKQELSNISGLGELKIKQYGDEIIATIYAFLDLNDLLHKFPEVCMRNSLSNGLSSV